MLIWWCKGRSWLFLRYTVTDPKPMCPVLQKAKSQNVIVQSKKKFIDWEGASWEDGRPSVFSSPS